MTDTQTTEVPTLIAHRKQAHAQLDSVIKKEAFINTLRKSLGRLTSDIKVGTRFISTNDYDGNLYECKQEPYDDLLLKPIIQDWNGVKKVLQVESRSREFQIDLMRTTHNPRILIQPQRRGLYYAEVDEEENTDSHYENKEGTYITISNLDDYKYWDFGDVYNARDMAAKRLREADHDEYWRRITNSPHDEHVSISDSYKPSELTFFVERVVKTNIQHDGKNYYNWVAEGYFPLIQRAVSRIWIRKCNLVGEALGKNIDSSHKCINFTQEIMSVREMLSNEREKLTKVRKVFNEHYPAKCRSKSLRSLKEESERLQPTLDRLTKLIDDMWGADVKVPAYFCKKYGFLIPIKADFVVDVSGNTLEVEMAEQQQKIHTAVDEQVALRKAVVEEVLPAALHPARVEKEIAKHDIDGTFGDDKVIVADYKTGKSGVVNESVFG